MDLPRRAVMVGVASVALLGCGGSGPAANGGSTPTAAASVLTKVVVDQSAAASTSYQIKGGQYKISWDSTGCTNLDVQVKQLDGTFTYEKKTTRTSFLAIIPSLPDGTYSIVQADPTCTKWTITLESTA